MAGDVTALTTRNVQAFAQISPSDFQDLLIPLFSFLFLWGQPSWGFSVLFCPKKGAVFASPIPCRLPSALFGLGFPVLLICCPDETRLFHTSCLISVLSPGRKASLVTSATFPLQVSRAAAVCWQTPSPALCPQWPRPLVVAPVRTSQAGAPR